MRTLFLFLICLSISFCEKRISSPAYVGGQAQELVYTKTTQNEALFSSEKYRVKTADVIKAISPVSILVKIGNKTQKIELIGLMDISPVFNGELRQKLTKKINKLVQNKKVKLYFPKDFRSKKLQPNHAFAISTNALLNAIILQEGLGIIPSNQDFYYPVKAYFNQLMNTAEKNKKGLWNERF
jgi:hypothetical protein